MSDFLATLRQRVLIFDGAFGTWVQGQDLGPDDFGGPALEGCNEHLVLTRPDLIHQMHRSTSRSASTPSRPPRSAPSAPCSRSMGSVT